MTVLRSLSIVLFLVISSGVSAQPNFTSDDFPQLGDRDTIVQGTQIFKKAIVTAGGADHTWDFSAMTGGPIVMVMQYRTPAASSSKPFTDANLEEYALGSGNETVWLYRFVNDTLYHIR